MKSSGHDSLLRLCAEMSTVGYDGSRVAADYHVEFVVDGERLGTLYTSPRLLDEAAAGLLLQRGGCRCGCRVYGEARRSGPLELEYRGKLVDTGGGCSWRVGRLSLSLLEELYRDFTRKLPKHLCPYAVHRIGLYLITGDSSYQLALFVADTSRHAAAVKLAGIISERHQELARANPIPVIVSTGRISSDMVRAFAALGIRFVVSFHHPVLSGLLAAEEHNVALILRDENGARFRVYTGHGLVDDS